MCASIGRERVETCTRRTLIYGIWETRASSKKQRRQVPSSSVNGRRERGFTRTVAFMAAKRWRRPVNRQIIIWSDGVDLVSKKWKTIACRSVANAIEVHEIAYRLVTAERHAVKVTASRATSSGEVVELCEMEPQLNSRAMRIIWGKNAKLRKFTALSQPEGSRDNTGYEKKKRRAAIVRKSDQPIYAHDEQQQKPNRNRNYTNFTNGLPSTFLTVSRIRTKLSLVGVEKK